MDTTKTITHVSLCAGYGGIDLGLKRAIPNLRTIAFSEIEAFATANLVSKMEAGLLDAAPIWTDLKTFPWGKFRGVVDILSGGYPCQPFSAAGKRLGTEDPRHLWPYIADGIAAMRPSVCFFENVEGHISLGLPDVIEDLGRLGYRTTWGIFSASEVGAPHQRKRVFIMAHDNSWGIFRSGYKLGDIGAIRQGRENTSEDCNNQQAIQRNGLANPNNGRGGEDQLLPKLWTTRIEQSPGCSWVSGESTKGGEVTIWPSRPGQPQFSWEPPRVVGNSSKQGLERSVQQSELQEGGSERPDENMGNAECFLLPTPGEHGAMAEEGGTSTREGSQPSQACAESGASRKRKCHGGNAAVQHETQPSMGGDPNGPSCGVGHAELYTSCDNRTDELRLLGNGVVPATAELAFRTLLKELTNL